MREGVPRRSTLAPIPSCPLPRANRRVRPPNAYARSRIRTRVTDRVVALPPRRAVRLSLEKFARLFLSNNDDETNTRVCDGETRRSTATAAGTRRSIHSFLDERWGDAAFSFASMADIVTQLHDSVRERSRPHSSRSRPLPWRSLARSPRPPHAGVRAFRPSLNDPSPLPSTRR